MNPEQLLRAILPDVLIDNFDIVSFDKSAERFDLYLDEKKEQLPEDAHNPDIIAYGFGEYRIIQDIPFAVVRPICMYASVNGLTSPQGGYSATTGTCLNLTVHGSMRSSWIF